MRKAITAGLSFKLSVLLITAPLFAPANNPPLAREENRPEVSLVGSAESLIWQNLRLDREGLERIKNEEELNKLVVSGSLVPLPLGHCLAASDKELEAKWRFVLPRVAKFLQDFSETVCPEFGIPVQINSAVRHRVRQLELIRVEQNLNAAPVTRPEGLAPPDRSRG